MIWNWISRRPLLTDLALVGLLTFLSVGGAVRRDHQQTLGAVLAAAETLPLLWRRRRPHLVLAAVAAVALAMIAVDLWLIPLQLGVALYTLAATRSDGNARVEAAVAIAAVALVLPLASGLLFGDIAARVVFLVAAFLLGDSVGSRRAYVREIEEKAERLERERETEMRRAAAEEQARIARELHDVVAHALSVIVVQAAAAADAFRVEPRLVEEPIRSIESASRAALADLRRVLGVLHQDVEYAPQPGLGGLDGLLEQVRATGLEVELDVRGETQPLPSSVDLSAFRIIQEALTNTLKHAQAEHARVRIRYGDPLRIEISDDGRGANGGGLGSGLVGMRERVSLLGGTIETGSLPGRGYRVAASIPAGRSE